MFLNKRNFTIYADGGDERDNNASNQQLVATGIIAFGIIPLVEGIREGPLIPGKSTARAAAVSSISRTSGTTFGFWSTKGGIIVFDVDNVTAIYR